MVALNSYRLCAFCGVPECDCFLTFVSIDYLSDLHIVGINILNLQDNRFSIKIRKNQLIIVY